MLHLRTVFLGLGLMAVMHPLPAAASFDQCVAKLRSTATASGVSGRTFDSAFRGLRPDPRVLEKARYQPEFTKAIWEYLDTAVSDKRVENGREMLARHKRTLNAIEKRYGVDKHIVLAVWGMESSYGYVLEDPDIVKSTIRSLATLACQDRRRSRFGRQQLVAALKILQNGDVSPRQMTGSWAGAMGHTQFIPTTYAAYAVDFTGDGKRDIWNSIPDALASTANYLRRSGWQTGKTWGYEVKVPRNFNFALADGGKKRTINEWRGHGVARANGKPFPRGGDAAELVFPAGAGGPGFLMLKNYRVIRRYNNALSYALAVGHLADRIRGGDTFRQGWPRNDGALSFNQRKELQTFLNRRGYATGGIDGKVGPKTRGAIRAFQRSAGLMADGHPSRLLLQRLRAGG